MVANLDISEKYKMGDISKGVANTLKPAKKIYKKCTFKYNIQLNVKVVE